MSQRTETESKSQTFDLASLIEKIEAREAPYLEFLRVPALSAGLYQLSAGESDQQNVHDEDEVYFVLKGRGKIVQGGETREVSPGTILYIPADSEHQFVEIEEDLSLLVFFGSGGPSGADV